MNYLTKLTVAVYYLGFNPGLNGDNSPAAQKGLKYAVAEISRLLKEQNTVVLNRKLKGAARPELLTSLEEDGLIPPTPQPPFVPATPSNNPKYIQLKKQIAILEESRIKVKNGNINARTAYRKAAAVVKTVLHTFRIVTNISTTRKSTKNPPIIPDE